MQKESKLVINSSSSAKVLSEKKASKSIDTRGMACPYPSFESVKAMSLINDANECVEIVTDSEESALRSIPNVCQKRNWQYLVFEEGKDLWRIKIQK